MAITVPSPPKAVYAADVGPASSPPDCEVLDVAPSRLTKLYKVTSTVTPSYYLPNPAFAGSQKASLATLRLLEASRACRHLDWGKDGVL